MAKCTPECSETQEQKQNNLKTKTDVDLVLEEITKRLKRIQQSTDKTLKVVSSQKKVDTAPVGIRAALKQKIVKRIFGEQIGSAIIRKGEKKRADKELKVQREEELKHERDLSEIRKSGNTSDTISKDINEKLDNLVLASQKMTESMSNMHENLLKVSTIVVAIQKRVSPRDVNVGKEKKIRYDPLAPAGYQYSEVTKSGKSGKIAKGTDANRAAFSASRQMAKEAVEDANTTGMKTRQMAKEAVEDANATSTKTNKDEYSEERRNVEKSQTFDMPTEDINAKRYEKIQETLDEIMKKLDDKGSFFGDLMKAIVGVGTTIALTLKSAIGGVMSAIGGIAASLGGKLAELATRLAPMIARFAGPAAGVAAAGYAGYKAGQWLNENTDIQENIASGIDSIKGLFGASDEDKQKQADTESAQKSYDTRVASGGKMNQSLANYYKEKGVSVDESLVVDDKTWATMNQSAKTPNIQPAEQRGAEIERESREMYDGKEDRKTNEIKTIVLPPPAAPPPARSSGGTSDMPVTIKVRNTDPTLSTYRASIFDHPVTHPGNYML